MKVLVIGPSMEKSKGGISTVIREMKEDSDLCDKFDIDFYESYIDGNKLKILLFSLFSFFKFIVTGKAKKYDIYHIHSASYGSTFRKCLYVKAIKKNNKKIIYHIHGGEYMKFFSGLSEKKKKMIVDMLKSTDIVVALSDEWKHRFESTFGISNSVAIENGINIDRLEPAITKLEEHPHVLVDLGRLEYGKGTYDLIEAVKIVSQKIPDVKVYLAGDGEIEKAKAIVRDKNLCDNIEIVGWADFDKKLELLSKASTVVLPSHNEGLPMSILEGMACGKAIISTTVGAIPEVVAEENGILISPKDVEALANAILCVCSDTKMMKKMSENNIKKIRENFDVKVMHQKIADIYEKVMGC